MLRVKKMGNGKTPNSKQTMIAYVISKNGKIRSKKSQNGPKSNGKGLIRFVSLQMKMVSPNYIMEELSLMI